MAFQTELHCHSCTVSACGVITPEQIVERYLEEGYSTVVLTEHFSHITFAPDNYNGARDWQAYIDFFLSGYNALKKAAGDRLHILLGAEVRVDHHSGTDFLVYGLTEEILRHDLVDLLLDNQPTMSGRVRAAGCLLVQAHPFRNNIRVVDPALLDGAEVFNGNLSHDARNDVAAFYAERYGLIPTSGTDLHRASATINGGIRTEQPITTNEELLAVLKNRAYQLIGP